MEGEVREEGEARGDGVLRRHRVLNHLQGQKSPYLLQHVRNPVDWHPWGEEAFEKARREDKPIILSIGYSTCHWCHVMERESFEDQATAEVMNKHFVCIKVDREERPDVDKIYMTAVQVMTGQGGWPLNAFLTPQLKPFFGGTYFPPSNRYGQPGWTSLLSRVAELWTGQRAQLEKSAATLYEALEKYAKAEGGEAELSEALLQKAFRAYQGNFDAEQGGFGGAPKFPMPVNLNFLLRYFARTGSLEALEMVRVTLRAMSRGGLFDHVGGGFSRYSTDGEWRVPHFEKMLYDNAQIASSLVEACQARPDPELEAVARRVLDYLLRDMRHAEGGFFSAEDADSLHASGGEGHKSEGAFYLWSESELRAVLGPDAELFIFRYGVRPEGNAPSDPHGEFTGKNILYAKNTVAETAAQFQLEPRQAKRRLDEAIERLLAVRGRRPRPELDDKILTSWNGLAISAFAKAAQAFDEPRYADAARAAAGFLQTRLYDTDARRLYHRWREGERAVDGLCDDYAFLAQGLLDLYEATFEPRWLQWALELSRTLAERFAEKDGGYYLTAEGHDANLILRVMDDSDNVEPCGSSVAALNGLRLDQLFPGLGLREGALKTLRRFGSKLEERPLSLAQMLCAVDFALAKPLQLLLAGPIDAGEGKAMAVEARKRFIPVKIAARAPDIGLEQFPAVGGKPTAYVCVNLACRLPVTDAAGLKALLDSASKR